MQIMVLSDALIKQEFINKKINPDIKVTFIENQSFFENNELDFDTPDAFFWLKDEAMNKQNYTVFGTKPVFMNAVLHPVKELNLPANFIRINGWPTFIDRNVWEVVTTNVKVVKDIFGKLGWDYISVSDEPGLVSARIISMIINEAYFALDEGVSSKEEIDIAMKLGTNYPYGPFEWSKKIGLQKVHDLLEKLCQTDLSYQVAAAMKKELFNN